MKFELIFSIISTAYLNGYLESIIKSFDIKLYHKNILLWYDAEKRDLPWRKTTDIYKIWISEVMLQQTQVAKVTAYYSAFLKVFPTVKHLAEAHLDDVLKIWEGLGYYARARNLYNAAQFIVKNKKGDIPATFAELLEIPGIGEYTAAAIASIASNEPRAVVDGNVTRVICRLFKIEESTHLAATRREISDTARQILFKDRAGDYNQAVMELGATLCTPQKPKCLLCPVEKQCSAYQNTENPARLPMKQKAKKVPHHDVAVGILWDEGHIFIAKREMGGVLGGMWDFPGFRFEKKDTPQKVLERELKNTYNFDAEAAEFIMEINHAYSHFKMTFHVFHCLYKNGEPPLNAAVDWNWARPAELKFYPFAAANKKIIQKLENEFVHANNRQ
ncbi:MAG: A/G-specific adenine glycosylase [Calditrichaeota bacterium]|nr:MAG: A/G-specific adenine glycosylase [Calditrichota bacterium]